MSNDIELPDLPTAFGHIHDANGNQPLSFERGPVPMHRAITCSARNVFSNLCMTEFATAAILADREKRAQAAQPMTLVDAAKSFPDGPLGAPVISKPAHSTTVETARDPHPNAFMQVPAGTKVTAHWPDLEASEPVQAATDSSHDTYEGKNDCRCEPSDYVPDPDYDGDGSVDAMARRASKPVQAEAPHADLMKFYSVDNLSALVDAQHLHIEKLQAKLPRNDQPAFTRVREG